MTVNRFNDVADKVECVQLSQLTPLTTLRVWTWHSVYRVVVMEGSSVWVQGGTYFPDLTSAQLDGATTGDGFVIHGWICIGFKLQLHAGSTRIMTSPVLAIASEPDRDWIAH
jgi:hypothetical protein